MYCNKSGGPRVDGGDGRRATRPREPDAWMPSVNAQKRIGIAALIWGASMMLSRAIGVIRESVIGRTLGDSPEADAYWAAFALPGFLQYMLAGVVLLQVAREHGDEAVSYTHLTLPTNREV